MGIPALSIVAALLLGAASCVSTTEYNRVVGANEALQAQRDDLQAQLAQRGADSQNQREVIADLTKRAAEVDWIKEQKERLRRLIAEYEPGGRREIEGVEVFRTAEGVSFRVQGEVLFSSGQAEVTETGKSTLKQLLATLTEEGKRIRVEGHTDSDPIRRSTWGTNLKLSTARAIAVAEFLIESGFDQERVAVAGYGEFRPAVEGNDEAAKRRNRRVEILMLDQ